MATSRVPDEAQHELSPEPEALPYASSLEHLSDELERIDMLVRSQIARARDAAAGEAYRGLAISEREVDALLERRTGAAPWDISSLEPSRGQAQDLTAHFAAAIATRVHATHSRLRLVELADRFELDRFELDVVLIALAVEIDLRYERLYAYLHDDVTRKRPSVDLALHLCCRSLAERFQARARFVATAPLLRHGLLRFAPEPSSTRPALLLARVLEVDERIVDWLHGSDELEAQLHAHAERRLPEVMLADLLIDDEQAQRLSQIVSEIDRGTAPVVYLQGQYGVGKRTTAEALAGALDTALLVFDSATLEGKSDDAAAALLRAVARETRLSRDLLCIEHVQWLLAPERPLTRASFERILSELPLPTVLTGETPWEPGPRLRERPQIRIELGMPNRAAQERLWQAALAGAPLAPDVDLAMLASSFRASGGRIHDAAAAVRGQAQLRTDPDQRIHMTDLVQAVRRQNSRQLVGLTRRSSARPSWDDLVLPPETTRCLRELCDQARHRTLVLESWGFERKLLSGKSLSALFAGPPGTGKTLAAAVIAAELGLELYPIDLASVVSKYIGETEKHLSRIFDEAERGHAVLFFDEADALFGKRTEVRDAHDRYANLETSYLLQRMENYEGVVILASNFRRNLDEAFVRRLRFILDFPLPDAAERLRIWQRILPSELPRSAELALPEFARRFELTGAHIRNIALGAAFLAAGDGQCLEVRHLMHATRREFQKMGRMVEEARFVELLNERAASSRHS